jgi:hypothetical protein
LEDSTTLIGLSYELQAYFADNAASEDGATEISIDVEKSQGHISVSPAATELQSTYVFTLDDASLVGHGLLPEHRLGEIVVVAASICCKRVYLSPVLLRRSVPRLTGRTGMFGTLTSLVKSGKGESISEEQFLDLANRLLRLETMPGVPVANLRQGFTSYHRAVLSIDPSTRYGHVWAALEKSVNTHHDDTGPKFDRKAAVVVGELSQTIEPLRELNNKLKHAFRNLSDVQLLDQLYPTLQMKSLDLKSLTDTALKMRLKEVT